ncbi:MAG: cysteine desulfurase family protein [Vicingaceae bacterium]
MKVYFDNAATTPIDPEVAEVMCELLKSNFGNPSSIHSFGRETRAIIERSRKQIASFLNVSPSEIYFTAGGTEADNMAIRCSVRDLNVKRIITSPIEHHAVLHTAEQCEQDTGVQVDLVKITPEGYVDMDDLERLLTSSDKKTLVSLMHANNEIGNLIDLKEVGDLCKEQGAFFHSDTVQTMAHYRFDFSAMNVDFATCSAHKFHGPKGIGFLYINKDVSVKPLIFGGSQERNMRAGTENVYGIASLAKAMEIAHHSMDAHQEHVLGIKKYMIEQLELLFPSIDFNGDPKGRSLYTVLNVSFPSSEMNEMFLYNLDIEGIAASGGSACSSGSNVGSHVLNALGKNSEGPAIRFSFSRFNTKAEVEYAVAVLKELYGVPA